VFPGADANCDVGRESLGIHCFGDFSAIRFTEPWSKPSGAELVYPLSSRLVRLPFFLVEHLTSYRFALSAFLVIGVAMCIFPLLHSLKNQGPYMRIAGSFIIGITNIGTISALDRGNIIVFCVPLIYLFWVAEARSKTKWAILSLCLAVSIKPQLVLLNALFLWKRKNRAAMVSTLISLLVLVAPYAVIDRGRFDEIRLWISEMRRWSQSMGPEVTYPPNVAFNRLFGILGLNTYYAGYLIAAAFILAITVTSRRNRTQSLTSPMIGLILVTALSGPIAYIYYVVLLIPAVAILLSDSNDPPATIDVSRSAASLLSLVLPLTLLPIAIPRHLKFGEPIGTFGTFNIWPPVVPGLILFSILGILLSEGITLKTALPISQIREGQ